MIGRQHTALVVMPGGPQRDIVVQTLQSLQNVDLKVSVAEEPYEATRIFVQQPVNLVVLSLERLTRGDRKFLLQLHRFAPDLRALILVPEGRRQDAVEFLEAGADALLSQTFLVAELRLLVRSLLRDEASDPLTRLPNRAAYELALPREIARAERDGTSLALGILDLDHFGQVNTDLGYSTADDVLVEVAGRIRLAFRVTDLVARWGGEEFVVVLSALPKTDADSCKRAHEALERARVAVGGQPVILAGKNKREVTVSGGFARFPHDVPDFKADGGTHLTAKVCGAVGRALFDLANARLNTSKVVRNSITGGC